MAEGTTDKLHGLRGARKNGRQRGTGRILAAHESDGRRLPRCIGREDHLQIVSLRDGGDLLRMFQRDTQHAHAGIARRIEGQIAELALQLLRIDGRSTIEHDPGRCAPHEDGGGSLGGAGKIESQRAVRVLHLHGRDGCRLRCGRACGSCANDLRVRSPGGLRRWRRRGLCGGPGLLRGIAGRLSAFLLR
jgi:hypothetical protein